MVAPGGVCVVTHGGTCVVAPGGGMHGWNQPYWTF